MAICVVEAALAADLPMQGRIADERTRHRVWGWFSKAGDA
jgi:hypothetical protein